MLKNYINPDNTYLSIPYASEYSLKYSINNQHYSFKLDFRNFYDKSYLKNLFLSDLNFINWEKEQKNVNSFQNESIIFNAYDIDNTSKQRIPYLVNVQERFSMIENGLTLLQEGWMSAPFKIHITSTAGESQINNPTDNGSIEEIPLLSYTPTVGFYMRSDAISESSYIKVTNSINEESKIIKILNESTETSTLNVNNISVTEIHFYINHDTPFSNIQWKFDLYNNENLLSSISYTPETGENQFRIYRELVELCNVQ